MFRFLAYFLKFENIFSQCGYVACDFIYLKSVFWRIEVPNCKSSLYIYMDHDFGILRNFWKSKDTYIFFYAFFHKFYSIGFCIEVYDPVVLTFLYGIPFSLVQLISHLQLFAIPWTAAHQASPSITNPQPVQTHVHWVGDAIQPSHSLSSPSPPAFNLSQHQGLFPWVGCLYQVTKILNIGYPILLN